MAKQSKYSIVIPVGMKPRPKIHEETAADILANHFKCDVYFIETGSHGTPDISIQGVEWEVKSPIGSSKNNIRKKYARSRHPVSKRNYRFTTL
ncbi:MAG: hypothetical protein ACREGJ_03930 [Candidatus Saccharimonadales bacterium]